MKLKLQDIVEAQLALTRLGAEKLPAKVAYSVGRNIQKVKPELENYDKTRTSLIKEKYGEAGEEGSYKVPLKNMEAFMKEITELLEVELELDIWKIKLSDIKIDISPLDLLAMEWMLENDLSEESK